MKYRNLQLHKKLRQRRNETFTDRKKQKKKYAARGRKSRDWESG